MGRIAILNQYGRTLRGDVPIEEAVGDPGGGALITGDVYQPGGDDSRPLPKDYMLLVSMPGSGRFAAVGFVDAQNPRQTEPGEKRIYSRQASGAVTAEVFLRADGTAQITAPGGISLNGVTIDANGNLTLPAGATLTAGTVEASSSLIAAGREHVNHVHAAGAPPGNTGPGPILP